MNLELLQQALMVEVDHKQLYPAISEYNDILYVQYDVGEEHLKIDVPKFVLTQYQAYKVIKNRVLDWYEVIK